MRLAQIVPINEKSTISTQQFWNFVKMTQPWDGKVDKVSLNLRQNHRIFTNSQFQCQSYFLCTSPYVNAWYQWQMQIDYSTCQFWIFSNETFVNLYICTYVHFHQKKEFNQAEIASKCINLNHMKNISSIQ